MAVRGDQLQQGSVVGGYRIDELIGRGGMGLVYRATNVALNRIYALKVLAPELAEDEQFRQRFKREMRIAASLHHPNVVGIHYAGEHEGLLFFVMDYITGTDLREVLLKCGALEPNRAVDLLEQLGSALDAAHRRGLVHRDVKPANVLITIKEGEEHAYLTDFGLAKKYDTASGLTAKGLVVGTVDYMAPEQITGRHTDARTDIYALGCVFYQMLTGKVPYDRDNSVATLFAHVHDPPPRLEREIGGRYPAFAPVLEKAMAKDPGDRYLSAGDFARDAAAALHGTRDTSPPTIVGTGDAAPMLAPHEETAAGYPPPSTGRAEPGDATVVADQPREQAPALAAHTVQPPDAETRLAPPSAPAPPPPSPAAGPPPARAGDGAPAQQAGRRSRNRFVLLGLGALVLIGGIVAAVVALSSGGSSTPPGQPFTAAANPVPTNRVTGGGTATVVLNGDTVTATVHVHGLVNQPHFMHIHAGGKGVCPPASAARQHNGHLAISTGNGIKFYGPPRVALTTSGDTSAKSIVESSRYPNTGNISYRRTFTVPPGVAAAIRANNGVFVVHGINYDGTGFYDDFLGASDLDPKLPGEATAPALCGTLLATKASTARRQGSIIYAAVLQPSVATSAAEGISFSLVCHLPPAQATPATDPRALATAT